MNGSQKKGEPANWRYRKPIAQETKGQLRRELVFEDTLFAR